MTDETDADRQEASGIKRLTTRLREATPTSRRSFLVGSAAIGGATLGGSGIVFASGDSDDASSGDGEGTPEEGSTGDDMSDVDVLNYALTLEHLENAFYEEGLSQFDEEALGDANALEGADEDEVTELYERLTVIGEHESAHVETLTAVIEQLGGTPVEEASYNFGLSDADTFLETASVLENTGVSAYVGALAMIDSAELQTAGASIATVEGRHAAYLNDVTGQSPFPNAFEEAATMEETLEAASGFFADDAPTTTDGEDGDGTGTSTDSPTDSETDTPEDSPTDTPHDSPTDTPGDSSTDTPDDCDY